MEGGKEGRREREKESEKGRKDNKSKHLDTLIKSNSIERIQITNMNQNVIKFIAAVRTD